MGNYPAVAYGESTMELRLVGPDGYQYPQNSMKDDYRVQRMPARNTAGVVSRYAVYSLVYHIDVWSWCLLDGKASTYCNQEYVTDPLLGIYDVRSKTMRFLKFAGIWTVEDSSLATICPGVDRITTRLVMDTRPQR